VSPDIEFAIGTRTPARSLPAALNPPPVTDLLLAWGGGDESAFHQLIPLVHVELRRLARRYMRGANHQTLQTTVLVNEAYLRLVDLDRVRWQDRAHFFAMAARLMRRVLVDHVRSHQFVKRGGGARMVVFDEAVVAAPEPSVDPSTSSGSTMRCSRSRRSIDGRATSSNCGSSAG
jgi:DNA-directed RNA polymerase specialized sigma24 family protein